jgi:hypothetical protein
MRCDSVAASIPSVSAAQRSRRARGEDRSKPSPRNGADALCHKHRAFNTMLKAQNTQTIRANNTIQASNTDKKKNKYKNHKTTRTSSRSMGSRLTRSAGRGGDSPLATDSAESGPITPAQSKTTRNQNTHDAANLHANTITSKTNNQQHKQKNVLLIGDDGTEAECIRREA